MTKAPNLLKDVQKIELDPTKQYVMFLPMMRTSGFDHNIFRKSFHDALRARGISNVLLVMIDQPADIRIIESPSHAKD
jgi:hypothetical protein